MKNYAVVEDELVINIVLWDGKSDWSPGAGIAVPAGDDVGIGWSYKKGKFTPPPIPEPSPDEISARNLASAQAAYGAATLAINALNEQIEDADYSGTTEDSVKAEIAAWIAYRVSLRAYIRIGDGSASPPESPDAQR